MRKSAPVGPNSWPRLPAHTPCHGAAAPTKSTCTPPSLVTPVPPRIVTPPLCLQSTAGWHTTHIFPGEVAGCSCLCCPPPAPAWPPPAVVPWLPVGEPAVAAWPLLAPALLLDSRQQQAVLRCHACLARFALHLLLRAAGMQGRAQASRLKLRVTAGNRWQQKGWGWGGWTPWVSGWSASQPGPPLTAHHGKDSRELHNFWRAAPQPNLQLPAPCQCTCQFCSRCRPRPRALGRCRQHSDAVLLRCT